MYLFINNKSVEHNVSNPRTLHQMAEDVLPPSQVSALPHIVVDFSMKGLNRLLTHNSPGSIGRSEIVDVTI